MTNQHDSDKEPNYVKEMTDGFRTAAVDAAFQSNLAYRPEFVSNNPQRGRKVLVSIEQELAACDQFKISVAFITKSGITPLLQILKELEQKGIPREILTTDYLTFSQPEALEKLASLSNIKLRMFRTDNDETGGFHTKGYIFRQEEIYRIIIGSSNMTQNAVTKNREWNTKLVSTEQGELAQEILGEFDALWNAPTTQEFHEFFEEYQQAYFRE
jgi:HKD family nuclease